MYLTESLSLIEVKIVVVKLKIIFNYARDLSYNNFSGDIPFNIGFLQVATL